MQDICQLLRTLKAMNRSLKPLPIKSIIEKIVAKVRQELGNWWFCLSTGADREKCLSRIEKRLGLKPRKPSFALLLEMGRFSSQVVAHKILKEMKRTPAKIFCAHNTADVPSGTFGPTSGDLLSATLLAIEAERVQVDLTG